MSVDRIRALQVNDTEIITPVVGASALRSTAVDGVGVTLTSGAIAINSRGASANQGIQADELSAGAGIIRQGALVASDAAAGVFSVENTYGTDLYVTRVLIFVQTPSTGACALDVGSNAAEVTDDDLLDGLSVAAAGIFDNIADKGTNGSSRRKWASGEFVTATMATGATAGLVGRWRIEACDMDVTA